MSHPPTSAFTAFALEPFPELRPGDDLAGAVTTFLTRHHIALEHGDIVVVASKVVSIAERRWVDLSTVTPGPEAVELSRRTGKPAPVVQVILDESTDHYLATERGPIIARHKLGLGLTSAGVDRAGPDGVWLLPADPDRSARGLRDALQAATGVRAAVLVVDSDGRPDRRGATVIAIGAAGIAPLRVTECVQPDGRTKRQEETFADLLAGAAGILLGQRGRGAPVAVLRGVAYTDDDAGVAAILHHRRGD
ncbi:coenzyme F420-0:L-glutamate ligase [Streptomyces sp. NPDC003717]|uniref:coenzyme F420-0:L-glutamate ligase n=1 Tax=Streptomyces sp. NPDC003717 TaxID=3154276 RepID=UPI0033BCC787